MAKQKKRGKFRVRVGPGPEQKHRVRSGPGWITDPCRGRVRKTELSAKTLHIGRVRKTELSAKTLHRGRVQKTELSAKALGRGRLRKTELSAKTLRREKDGYEKQSCQQKRYAERRTGTKTERNFLDVKSMFNFSQDI